MLAVMTVKHNPQGQAATEHARDRPGPIQEVP